MTMLHAVPCGRTGHCTSAGAPCALLLMAALFSLQWTIGRVALTVLCTLLMLAQQHILCTLLVLAQQHILCPGNPLPTSHFYAADSHLLDVMPMVRYSA